MAEVASWKTAAGVMGLAVAVVTVRASWLLTLACFPFLVLVCCYTAGFAVDTFSGDSAHELLLWRKRLAYRPLSFTTPSAWSAGITRLSWEDAAPTTPVRIHQDSPKSFDDSLNCLLQLVKRDFILPWYSRISGSAAFPNAVDRTVRQSLANLIINAAKVDWADVIVSKTVPLLKDHIEHYKRVEGIMPASLAAENSIPLPPKHHPAVASHHTPSLAPAAVEAHVQKTVGRLLGCILPPKDSASQSVRIMTREIVTMMLLMPVIDTLSDGDYWNRLIEERGKRRLHEEKLVKKVLSALDSTRPPKTARTPSKDRRVTTIALATSRAEFDTFVRSLRKVKVLGKAKQYRADIEREIRKATDLESQTSDLEQVGKLKDYVERLQKARLVIEVRVEQLSGIHEEHITALNQNELAGVRLSAILANQASTVAWLEHMERRGKAVSLQFWLLAESLKDPLEALPTSIEPSDPDPLEGSERLRRSWSGSRTATETLPDLATSQVAREDIRSLWYTYFDTDKIQVSESVRERIRQFALDVPDSNASTRRDTLRVALAAVFEAQQEVYEQMVDREWDDFCGTELYRKALADLQEGEQMGSSSPRLAGFPALPLSPPAPSNILKHLLSPGDRRDRPNNSSPGFTFFNRLNRSAAPASPSPVRPSISPIKSDFSSTMKSPIAKRQLLSRGTTWAATNHVSPSLAPTQDALGQLMGSPEMAERAPLFGDDSDEEEALDTEAQLKISKRQQDDLTAALTTIIAGEDEEPALDRDTSETPSDNGFLSPAASLVLPDRPQVATQAVSVGRIPLRVPSTESLKKPPGEPSALGPVNRVPLHGDIPVTAVDDGAASDEDVLSRPLTTRMAFDDQPLHVAIERLQEQEALHIDHIQQLQSYMDIAELHASDEMLRLCRQSMARVRKDLASVQLRITNYLQQQEETRLVFGRTNISIPKVSPTNGVYWFEIIVNRTGQAEPDVTSWTVIKRFSQFDDLKKHLSDWIDTLSPSLKASLRTKMRRQTTEFPAKSVITKSNLLQEHRRQALEKYLQVRSPYLQRSLQSLLSIPEFCDAPCMQHFLDRNPQDLSVSLSLLQKSLTSTSDSRQSEEENTFQKLLTAVGSIGGQFVEDLTAGPTIMINSVQTALSQQAAEMTRNIGDFVAVDPEAAPSFVQPLQDLCMALLDYDASAWNIRRPAVIGTLQAIAGTIEKQVRAFPGRLFSFEATEQYLSGLRETLWPNGQRRATSTPRTDGEKHRSRVSADKLLYLLVPDAVVTFCGKKYIRKGIRRSMAVLQDRRLNQHLILTILDDIVDTIIQASSPTEHTA